MADLTQRPTVSLCMIVLDGEPYLDNCLASVVVPCIPRYGGPAFDEVICLVDDRTTDRTMTILAKWAVKQHDLGGKFVIETHTWPDDFSVARQRSFELATGDWRGWGDSDDVWKGAAYVKPTLNERIGKAVMLDLEYHYIVAPDGRVKQKQIRERFVKWDYGFKWIYPVHEALVPSKSMHNPRRARPLDEEMLVIHQRPEVEILGHGSRNEALMAPDRAISPIVRHRLLYHRALFLKGQGDRVKAEEHLREVAETKETFTDMDSFHGAIWALGELLAEDGRYDEAKIQALRHIERAPASRRGRFLMGFIYARMGNHFEAIRWIIEAFGMPKPEEYVQEDEEQFALLAAAATLAFPCPFEVREIVNTICQREVFGSAKIKTTRDLQQTVRTTKMETTCRDYLRYMEDHEEFDRAYATGLLIPYPLKRNVPIAIQRRRTANYLKKHGTSDFNGTWGGIPQDYVDAIITDDRTKPGHLSRAIWAAERLWTNGWKRVLEVGCCDGLILGSLAARFPDREFIGVDPDPFVIAHAKKMWGLPNLRFEHAPLGEPFAALVKAQESWCDGWVLFEVAEHVKTSGNLCLPSDKPGLITTPTTQPDSGAPPEITEGPAGHRRILTMAEILTDFAPSSATVIDGGMCPQTAIEVPKGKVVRHAKDRCLAPWYLFLCLGSPANWGPETPYTLGLTGSEWCVIALAETLAQGGNRVVVMNDRLSRPEHIAAGVLHTTPDYCAEHDLYDPEGYLTTLVVWRHPLLTDFVKSLPVAKRVLWLHDAAGVYSNVNPKAWEDFDKIVCATEYQRRTFEDRYPIAGKTAVIRHGILEIPEAEKIPGKIVYASSPDRGLDRLLRWWPAVVERVPGAMLHIFYGRNNMRAFAALGFSEMDKDADRFERMISETPNVVDHGRVPHPELYQHLAEAKIFTYPTGFEEINCLSIQQAQAARCIPVWSEAGCLREVVSGEPFWHDPATLDSEEAKAAFIRSVVAATTAPVPKVPNLPTWHEAAKKWGSL